MACTIKELINELSKFPPEFEVAISIDVSKDDEAEHRAFSSDLIAVQSAGNEVDIIFTGVLNFKPLEVINNGL